MKIFIKNISFLLLVITVILVISNCSKDENPIIPGNPELTLIYPVGGESIIADTTVIVKWLSTNVDFISIYLSTNSGIDWTEIINSVSAESGEWNWTTPNLISDSCKIKIVSKSDLSINDESDSSFSIVIDFNLNLMIPNGGELWESLTDYSIEWTSENIDNIIIEYTSDNGNNWGIIDTVSAQLSEYTWRTNYQPSENYKIRIGSLEYPAIVDESENTFVIVIKPGIIESLNYYPLAIGNKWFYKTIKNQTTITYSTREVTDYIKMENNKYYFLVSGGFPWTVYERLDSLNGLVYRFSPGSGNEIVYDDLVTEPGKIVNTWRMFDGIGPGVLIKDEYPDTVLQFYTTIRAYTPQNVEVLMSYALAKYFGLTGWYTAYWDTYSTSLIAAYIDGVFYGDTTKSYYNKHFDYYPLEIGNKWTYEYKKYSNPLNIIRSTILNREVVKDSLFNNGYRFFKIVSQFEDSLQIFIDWQRLDTIVAKLYGYDITMDEEFLIDDYTISDEELHAAESYIYSIFPYLIDGFIPQYPSANIKTYFGGNYDNETFYEFTKYIGLSKIILTWYPLNPQIIEELNLISSEIHN